MIVKAAMMLSTAFSMSGCGGLIIYDGSRTQSRDVIGRSMARRAPNVDSDAAARCVVNGMTVQEVVTLGVSDVRRVTPRIDAKIDEVLLRPGVTECIDALPQEVVLQ